MLSEGTNWVSRDKIYTYVKGDRFDSTGCDGGKTGAGHRYGVTQRRIRGNLFVL